MTAVELLAQPGARLLTLSLLHFLWQGLAICLLLAAVVGLGNLRRATTRYACSLAALVVMTICPMATLAWLAALRPSAGEFDPMSSSLEQFSPQILPPARWLEMVQPSALAAWLSGVGLFSSRLLVGALGISRLRRGRLPLPAKMATAVQRLGGRLRIDAAELVFLSKQVADAMAVGLVRPLVLIPAAWATEMPLPMLEAVIAHELAHLARHDLWVNLLQRTVETLLFYHPAVWWLSRRLRIERELCADELAVAATGDRLAYAQALEQIAGERQADIRPALAAFLRGETDMRLLERVRNVLGQSADQRSRLWPAGIIALALPLGLWAAAVMTSAAIADDDEPKKPAIKRERDEGNEERRVTIRKKAPQGEEEREVEVEERVIKQLRSAKPDRSPNEEIVEERVIKRGGKPIVEVQLGHKELRDDSGERRIDELTVLVKRLAAQVERLQDEVASLRGGKPSQKQLAPEAEQLERRKKQTAERDQNELRKRELDQAAEKIGAAQRALAEKQKATRETVARADGEVRQRIKQELDQKLDAEQLVKALEEKLRAAERRAEAERAKAQVEREKAEAERAKVEVVRRSVEEQLRALKEREKPR